MARRTKKEIYAAHGITFDGGKILSPFGWIPPLMPIDSNGKIGDAATWSIYHGNETTPADAFGPKTRAVLECAGLDSITGSCPCHCAGCYCDAHRYTWDTNKASNVLKLVFARLYPDFMVAAIKAQIEADGITQVRIHASGDFFSPEYVAAWVDIITSTPGVTYWAYTKYAPALAAFDALENVSIVPSMTPAGINFGTCAELLERRAELIAAGYRVHICACGTPFQKKCAECSTGCKAIGRACDYVLFIKHSTGGYRAGKHDAAEYAAVLAVVENQEN